MQRIPRKLTESDDFLAEVFAIHFSIPLRLGVRYNRLGDFLPLSLRVVIVCKTKKRSTFVWYVLLGAT